MNEDEEDFRIRRLLMPGHEEGSFTQQLQEMYPLYHIWDKKNIKGQTVRGRLCQWAEEL